jgi:hypothetical protein
MGIMAGIGGLVGGLGGLFGGGTNQPAAPPQFQMPNMGDAANNAFSGIGGLQPFSSTGANALPFANQTFSNLYNNPFSGQFQGAANTASGMGQNAALGAFNTGGQLTNAGLGMIPQANQIFQTGFDPQNALYGRTLQQTQDQTRAGLEARGMDNTPYGAGVEGQALSNFNIDWQNNLLQRQAMAANAGGGLMQTGAGIANMGAGIQNTAPGQYFSAGAMPYGAFGQIGGDQNAAIAALLSSASGGQQLGNVPIQDYLGYLSAGNQANSVANQNYGLQLQAQQQQFNEQLKLGGLLGQSMYGLGRSIPGGGLLGGSNGIFSGNFGFG